MRPDYHQAIIDTIRFYGWDKITYLYDSHDGKYIIKNKYSPSIVLNVDDSFSINKIQTHTIYCNHREMKMNK